MTRRLPSCSARPRLEAVWTAAERGETMPAKTTYFFPKLVSGLLLMPLD